MLRASSGATVAAMMAATEWQQHSVRGFLAGVIAVQIAAFGWSLATVVIAMAWLFYHSTSKLDIAL